MTIMQTLKAAAGFDTGETTRLAKRREIKRGLARRRCLEGDLARLRSEAAAIENRINVLSANHESEVATLRAEMDKLAEQTVDGPSEKLTAKRTALQQQIIDKTKSLEKSVGDARREMVAVRKLAKPLEAQVGDFPIESALGRDDTANPALLVRSFVIGQRTKFLQARLENAMQWLKVNANELNNAKLSGPPIDNGPHFQDSPGRVDPAAVRLYQRRVTRWQAEVAASEAELTEALAESQAIHRQMIEE